MYAIGYIGNKDTKSYYYGDPDRVKAIIYPAMKLVKDLWKETVAMTVYEDQVEYEQYITVKQKAFADTKLHFNRV